MAQPAIGVFGGVGSTTLRGDSPSDGIYVPGVSIAVGAIGDFQVHPEVKLSLQPSWTIFQGQIHFLDTIEDEYNDSINYKIDFLALSVLFKALSLNEKWQFLGGFEVGYGVNTLLDDGSEERPFDQNFRNWNLAAVFAVGYLFPIGRSDLFLEGRYTQGLENLTNDLQDFNNPFPRVKTSSLRLTLGWLIPIQKVQKDE